MQEHQNGFDDTADLHRAKDEERSDVDNSVSQGVFTTEKLSVSGADDPTELEANTIARKVAAGEHVTLSNPLPGKREINKKPGDDTEVLSENFSGQLAKSKGAGESLSGDVQNDMESKMGANFTGVKVHHDSSANTMNDALEANAFAHGNDIYFKDGLYNPASAQGVELLAHELVHTRQPGENQIRRNNGDDLKKLGEHHSGTKGKSFDKEKAGKQKEVDEFIKKKGGEQTGPKRDDEHKRQDAIIDDEQQLKKNEERILAVRYSYIEALRKAGVTENDVENPFDQPDVAGVNKQEFIDALVKLYELCDAHTKSYIDVNRQIRADKESILEGETDKKELIKTYGLTLTGVHADKSVVTKPAKDRAVELLKWAEVEVRTSYKKYRTMVGDQEKTDRNQKKFENGKQNEFDPFETAQTIIRNDLNGDETVLSEANLQIVLRYFLKGPLSEDDKFELVRFLDRHIKNGNLEKVFGYSEDPASDIIDPAAVISVLDSYSLLNDERRDYFARQQSGNKEYLELETSRKLLVIRLKDMKMANDANSALKKKNLLDDSNQKFTGLQEPFQTKGFSRFTSLAKYNVAQSEPKQYFPSTLLGSFETVAASKLQDAINKFERAVPTPAITDLQNAAWEYYQTLSEHPLSQTAFNNDYATKASIQHLLNSTSNPVYQEGGKYKSQKESLGELGGQLFEIALKTGVDYFRLKERVEYFKKTNPSGYQSALISLGVTGLILAIADSQDHPNASFGQTLIPFTNLGLGHQFELKNTRTPVYDAVFKDKMVLDVNTKRDDKPPGLTMFNSMYNPGNTHPMFKGASNSVPGIFLNTGLSGSSIKELNGAEDRKWTYDFKVTFHWAPGSEGTTGSQETTLGRIGMFMQNPFDPDKAQNLLANSPTRDMFNMWGSAGGSYKKDWFTASGSVGAGTYNMGGPAAQQMQGMSYKFNADIDKIKAGHWSFGGGSGISGSYADSPSTDATSSATWSNKLSVGWRSVTLNFSFDDDLTKPAVFNKYKAELEFLGKGRYGAFTMKAMLQNMYDLGLNQTVISGGLGFGFKFGSGGKVNKSQLFKFK